MAEAVAIQVAKGPSVSYAVPLAEQREALKGGKVDLDGALANLLLLEKTARLSGDISGTTELCTGMVEICFEQKKFAQLNETIALLAKRRAQIKEAVGAMVRTGSEYAFSETAMPDEATRLALIEALRAVSEGKMFVEVERARLTRKLAEMHEAGGKPIEARKIMIETVVETLGGMGKREKTDFILEQVRLCLDTEEYVRAQIMARKINVKVRLYIPACAPTSTHARDACVCDRVGASRDVAARPAPAATALRHLLPRAPSLTTLAACGVVLMTWTGVQGRRD